MRNLLVFYSVNFIICIEALLGKYLACIFKLKGISSIGVEQLLLDTQSLKSILLRMSTVGSDPGTQVSAL